ncbi:putative mst3-like protein kinase [Phaeomoniella chlamydospora]|uniref:non-specific serine/threonine protein kinase n=1 Tax=Phaeomoniella chlamydospora TaxID=158046 RepID=A0A0G2ENK5_PHACM|nr:putative mst3-like protein kinase [Phaeomoniella chlamydospora]
MLEELGSGSFGTVYKAIERSTGEIVAIKHIDLESSEDDIQEIQQEISVLSTCASPYVTQYRTSFLRGYKLWIVMEFLGGGSCQDLLKPGPFNEAHIAIVCRELLLGLNYLHQEGKIHRDVKAANVLLSQAGKVKLADFGVAAQLTNIKSQRNTFVGTPFWMAPEVIQQAGYDFKADIWSLGITAMELVNGEPPNASTHPMKVLFLIPKAPAPRLEGNNYSKDFKDFVASCLIKDPDRRPTAKELLRHRFIRNAGKTEALQELVLRRQDWESGRDNPKDLKYYAETLKSIASSAEDDAWVFDTVKAPTIAISSHTQKRRKLTAQKAEEIQEQATAMMEGLSIAAETPKKKIVVPEEMSSTMRRIPEIAQDSPVQHSPSVRKATKKRYSSGHMLKQPLGVNMSFGNSPSTVRQFRRVSPSAAENNMSMSKQPNDTNAENMPPRNSAQEINPLPETKESILGRRAYSDDNKREAISRLAECFSDLEQEDPEGMYHIVKLMVEKMQGDAKLAGILPSFASSNPNSASGATDADNQPKYKEKIVAMLPPHP